MWRACASNFSFCMPCHPTPGFFPCTLTSLGGDVTTRSLFVTLCLGHVALSDECLFSIPCQVLELDWAWCFLWYCSRVSLSLSLSLSLAHTHTHTNMHRHTHEHACTHTHTHMYTLTLTHPPTLTGRPWPVTLGLGYGLGYSMANCQHDFSRLPSPYLRPSPAQTTPTSGAEVSYPVQ